MCERDQFRHRLRSRLCAVTHITWRQHNVQKSRETREDEWSNSISLPGLSRNVKGETSVLKTTRGLSRNSSFLTLFCLTPKFVYRGRLLAKAFCWSMSCIFHLSLSLLILCMSLYLLVNICAGILSEFNLIKCPNQNFSINEDCSPLCSILSMSFKTCIFHLNLDDLLFCVYLFPLFKICLGIHSEFNLIKCPNQNYCSS